MIYIYKVYRDGVFMIFIVKWVCCVNKSMPFENDIFLSLISLLGVLC